MAKQQPGQPARNQAPRNQGQKQAQDAYAQRLKTLSSAVQRLRGWVGSDPARNAELGDALVAATAHRLHGHAYAEAAADAQEAVVVSGRLLAERGPIGPYTPVPDAVRYFTAAVHLAAVQAGLGLMEPAGRTLQAAAEWREQLRRHVDIAPELAPTTAVWVLWVQGRAALAAGDLAVERLAGGDLAGANAAADAALDRLVEGGLAELDDSYLALDVHRLVADARWVAGDPATAVTHDELARQQLDRVVAGRLSTPARLSPALLTRLSEPVFVVNRAAADRLVGSGDGDRGLVVRRNLIELLRGLAKRGGDAVLVQLARSLDDLAGDLRLVGRASEAELAAEEALKVAGGLSGAEVVRAELGSSADRPERRPGAEFRDWPALDPDQALAATTVGGVAARLEAEAELLRAAKVRAEAERAEAQRLEEERRTTARDELARREAERLVAERAEAERVERQRAEDERSAAERAEQERQAAEQAAAEEEAARLETKRRREERLEEHRREEERLERERQEAERLALEQTLSPEEFEQRELQRLAAELAELERAEQRRVEAERAETERVEAERLEAERAETERAHQVERDRAESERVEAERVEAGRIEAARIEAERVERERTEQDRAQQAERDRAVAEQAEREPEPEPAVESAAEPEPEAVPVDELDQALGEWQAAKSAGERRRSRAANERVVELLRPRAAADPPTYGLRLVDALEQLSSIRLRTGDLFGSRAPAREAKALARALGR